MCISKVFKSNNKLVIYLPFDVIKALGVKEGDEIDFLPYMNKYYIIAKKSDITELIIKPQAQVVMERPPAREAKTDLSVNGEELAVLKKLDMLRYNERTQEKVVGILNGEEKQVLQKLLKKGFLVLYKKGSEPARYSIPKNVYDAFMWRKAPQSGKKKDQPIIEVKKVFDMADRKFNTVVDLSKTDEWLNELQSKGFLVLSNEAEASNLSTALEESIRSGLVVGTRAFNKKFYIALKSFVNKNVPNIFEALGKKTLRVEELAKQLKLDENAIRAILYILSESGEISEVKKDFFKAV